MPEKKDSYQATTSDVKPDVANQQVVQVLLDLLKEARQRASVTTTVELSDDELRDIASATAIFTLIEGGLNLETPFANTRTENNSGPAGTEVRITGTNFAPPAAVVFEKPPNFPSTPATSVTLVDPTLIKAVAPPRSGSVTLVDVVVTTFGGTVRVVNGFQYT